MRQTILLAILLSAAMLVSAVTAATVLAQPFGYGKERGHMRPLVEPILMGHGFAFAPDSDQYHILHVNALKMSDASPGFFRSLPWQKISPEEIRNAINDAQMTTKTMAHLRFAGQAYALNVTAYDNRSLTGDVLTLSPRGGQTDVIPTVVGHIALSISEYEGEVLSTGTLTMNGTDYRVLMSSPRPSLFYQ